MPSFGQAKGITEEDPLVAGLERMLTPGSSSKLADDQIVIGENIAQRLGIQLGDALTIYSPVSFEGLTHDEIIFPQELKVAGFFSAESYARDTVVCSLACMQKLYELESWIHGMALKVHKGVSLEPLIRALQQKLGPECVIVD